MKHHELIFSIIKIPWDFLIVFFAFFLARNIRLITDLIPGVNLPVQTIENASLFVFASFGALLYIIVFAMHQLYKLQISHSKIWEVLDVIRYGIYWFLFFSVGVYLGNGVLYEGSEIPRLIIIFTLILSVFWSIILRICINTIQSILLHRNMIPKRNIVLISNKDWKELKNILRDIKQSKIYNILWYSNDSEIKKSSLNYIWSISALEELFKNHVCDEILYIESDYSKSDLYKIWSLSRTYGIKYRYVTNSFDVTKTNTILSLIHQTPVIEIQNTPLEYWGRIVKRVTDIIGSGIMLVISIPLFIIVSIFIKIEDPSWPVIYKNRRIGQNGKTFNCYKFRYLKWKHCVKESYGTPNNLDPAIDFEKQLISEKSTRNWPLYKIQKDPRKTKIWTLLEKYSLDEVPQFINVFLWDMSLVGPRPHQPREVEKYKKYQKRLLTIKPWISGMAQVNGRDQNNFEKEAKLDIFYIENWSFLLDLKIIAKTLTIILSRK